MMKIAIKLIVIALLLLAFACQKEQTIANKVLTGTWQLDAIYIDSGDGSGTYMPVTNAGNNSISLKANGAIEVSGLDGADGFLLHFSQYKSYTVKDSVTLAFKKWADTTTQNFMYKLAGDKLSLSPAGPLRCIEGCGVRFKKVN